MFDTWRWTVCWLRLSALAMSPSRIPPRDQPQYLPLAARQGTRWSAALRHEAVEYLLGTLPERARPRALENREGGGGLPPRQIPATQLGERAGQLRAGAAQLVGRVARREQRDRVLERDYRRLVVSGGCGHDAVAEGRRGPQRAVGTACATDRSSSR